MKKYLKHLLTLITSLILIFCVSISTFAVQHDTSTLGSGEIPYQSYTYWEDFDTSDKTAVYSKPMYELDRVINPADMGADAKSKINDIVLDKNGNTYVLDSGNSRIYVVDKNYKHVKTLGNFTYKGEAIEYTDAKGIYVDVNGCIYVCDTENARVLVINPNGVVENLLLLPDSEFIPTGFKYRPVKMAIDSKGYKYIASDGSYYGAILYSPEMEFLGFFGANTVKATALDVIKQIWDRLFSNDIKRAADEISLPYTFTDIVVGPNDFVYTSTGRTSSEDVETGQICRLNPGGKNVLNGENINFADKNVGSLQRQRQYQDLATLDVDENGFFYALDTTYGRVFWYDSECNLLSIFAGSFGDGIQKGTFGLPSGIVLNGTDVIVSDAHKNSLTVFSRTAYGAKVYETQLTTLKGNFASTKDAWTQIIKEDLNNQLAYRGLAKAYYDLGENKLAMDYAKQGVDREVYAKAFKIERNTIIENNFGWLILAGVILIAAIVFAVIFVKKRNIVLVKNQRLKVALSSVAHPVESFRLVKEKGQGSVIIGTVLLLIMYVVTVISDTKGGFAFTIFDKSNYNAIFVFLSTVGLALLWVVSNWLVCSLASGIGTLKEIYVVTCYSTIPIIFSKVLNLILTHVLIPDEAAFLGIFMTVCSLYALFMLIIGIMRIHDYEFGKFLGTTIFTLAGMLIIIFLIFLVYLLSQQVVGWFGTLFVELYYR